MAHFSDSEWLSISIAFTPPFIKGRDIDKYHCSKPTNFLRHNYSELLRSNDVFRFSSEFLNIRPKLVYRQTSNRIIATLDNSSFYLDKTVHLVVPRNNVFNINLRYLLALLNSSLFSYFYTFISQETEGRAFSQVKTTYIKQLPIKIIDESEQQQYVSIVDEILGITKVEDYLKNYSLQHRVKEFEIQIDQMVYKLYGLSPEEIALVEGNLTEHNSVLAITM